MKSNHRQLNNEHNKFINLRVKGHSHKNNIIDSPALPTRQYWKDEWIWRDSISIRIYPQAEERTLQSWRLLLLWKMVTASPRLDEQRWPSEREASSDPQSSPSWGSARPPPPGASKSAAVTRVAGVAVRILPVRVTNSQQVAIREGSAARLHDAGRLVVPRQDRRQLQNILEGEVRHVTVIVHFGGGERHPDRGPQRRLAAPHDVRLQLVAHHEALAGTDSERVARLQEDPLVGLLPRQVPAHQDHVEVLRHPQLPNLLPLRVGRAVGDEAQQEAPPQPDKHTRHIAAYCQILPTQSQPILVHITCKIATTGR